MFFFVQKKIPLRLKPARHLAQFPEENWGWSPLGGDLKTLLRKHKF